MWLKRFQLGLIHVAVAITLVPINSTLNRVMIKELAISATLVAVLVSLPYVFSPVQVAIGAYADRHPIGGRRRTPYIVLGLLMCVAGSLLAPYAAFALAGSGWLGLLLSLLAFGAWGTGYNLAAVSYLSLTSELWDEKGRGRTISVMWFMMIVAIIATSIGVARIVTPYTAAALQRAFWAVGGVALVLGFLGMIRLEPAFVAGQSRTQERHSWSTMARAILMNRQATLFFWYLILMLAAILGQDVLLEPFGAEAFGLAVNETTRITSLWGAFVLVTLLAAGPLQARFGKRRVAVWGAWGALIGFVIIALSGLALSSAVFYAGVVLLGLGTGLATVANLALMLDMTTPESVGLFIGAWGMANALARLVGSVLGGAVRDAVTRFADHPAIGYVVVFVIEALLLLASLILLRWIDVGAFREETEKATTVAERAALLGEAGGG